MYGICGIYGGHLAESRSQKKGLQRVESKLSLSLSLSAGFEVDRGEMMDIYLIKFIPRPIPFLSFPFQSVPVHLSVSQVKYVMSPNFTLQTLPRRKHKDKFSSRCPHAKCNNKKRSSSVAVAQRLQEQPPSISISISISSPSAKNLSAKIYPSPKHIHPVPLLSPPPSFKPKPPSYPPPPTSSSH